MAAVVASGTTLPAAFPGPVTVNDHAEAAAGHPVPAGRSAFGVERSVTGRIRYTSNAQGRRNAERGRESFQVDWQADGARVVAAHCEIDDAPSVVRDINLRLDPGGRPAEAFVRIAVGGSFRGSGWFLFDGADAGCEALTSVEGRIHQRLALAAPVRGFVNHAIANDALLMRLYDRTRGGRQQIAPLLLSSPDHRGATGPMLFESAIVVDYLGETDLEVPAGAFQARHFRIVEAKGLPLAHPPYDIWVSADDDFLFLRGEVGGYMQTVYELDTFQVSTHAAPPPDNSDHS